MNREPLNLLVQVVVVIVAVAFAVWLVRALLGT